MGIRSWTAAYVPWVRPEGYIDDQGRARTDGGYLEHVELGSDDFQRDFTRLPGWKIRNVDWWTSMGLEGGKVYGCSKFGKLFLLSERGYKYSVYAGSPVPGYDGPYLTPAASRYYGISKPWIVMRAGGRSHNDERIQYPGYGGSVPESYGGYWTFLSGLTEAESKGNWRERVKANKAARLKAKLSRRKG